MVKPCYFFQCAISKIIASFCYRSFINNLVEVRVKNRINYIVGVVKMLNY